MGKKDDSFTSFFLKNFFLYLVAASCVFLFGLYIGHEIYQHNNKEEIFRDNISVEIDSCTNKEEICGGYVGDVEVKMEVEVPLFAMAYITFLDWVGG